MSKSHVGHMRVRWVRTTEMDLPLGQANGRAIAHTESSLGIRIEWLGKNCPCPNCQRIVLRARK